MIQVLAGRGRFRRLPVTHTFQASPPILHPVPKIQNSDHPALAAPVNRGRVQTLPVNNMAMALVVFLEMQPARQQMGGHQFQVSRFRVAFQCLCRIKKSDLTARLLFQPLTQKKPEPLPVFQNEGFPGSPVRDRLTRTRHADFLSSTDCPIIGYVTNRPFFVTKGTSG